MNGSSSAIDGKLPGWQSGQRDRSSHHRCIGALQRPQGSQIYGGSSEVGLEGDRSTGGKSGEVIVTWGKLVAAYGLILFLVPPRNLSSRL